MKLGLDSKIQVAVTIGNHGFLKPDLALILPDPRAIFLLFTMEFCFPSKSVGSGRHGNHKLPNFPAANSVYVRKSGEKMTITTKGSNFSDFSDLLF